MVEIELQCSPLGDQAYEVFRAAIINGDFTPGQRISVQELSERLRISVTPVRDALRRLDSEGLIRVVPRRGTFVTEFSAQDVKEIFQSRLIIELAAVEALPSLPEEAVQEIAALVQDMETLLDGEAVRNYSRYLELDEQFHYCIVQMLGNQRLADFYQGLKTYTYVARALTPSPEKRMPQTHIEHCEILDAFRQRDVARSKQVIASHLENAAADIIHKMPPRAKSS